MLLRAGQSGGMIGRQWSGEEGGIVAHADLFEAVQAAAALVPAGLLTEITTTATTTAVRVLGHGSVGQGGGREEGSAASEGAAGSRLGQRRLRTQREQGGGRRGRGGRRELLRRTMRLQGEGG